MEKWKMFYYSGKCLGGYTIRGTSSGEEESTKALLAYRNGVSVDDIEVRIEYR